MGGDRPLDHVVLTVKSICSRQLYARLVQSEPNRKQIPCRLLDMALRFVCREVLKKNVLHALSFMTRQTLRAL